MGLFDRIKKIFPACLASVAVAGLVSGVSVWAFGKPLLSIYITDSTEAILHGVVRLAYLGIPYFLCGHNLYVYRFGILWREVHGR